MHAESLPHSLPRSPGDPPPPRNPPLQLGLAYLQCALKPSEWLPSDRFPAGTGKAVLSSPAVTDKEACALKVAQLSDIHKGFW